jgi:putative flavoprotein involved in K+ transport
LEQRALLFRILDAGAEIGHVWRSRWDSLYAVHLRSTTISLGWTSTPERHLPVKDDVADYLHDYATKFGLPIEPDTTVTSLSKQRRVRREGIAAGVRGEAGRGLHGPFHTPFVPSMGESLDPEVTQIQARSIGDLTSFRREMFWSWAPVTLDARSLVNCRPLDTWTCPWQAYTDRPSALARS